VTAERSSGGGVILDVVADETEWDRRYRESLESEQRRIESEERIETRRLRANSPLEYFDAQTGVLRGLGLLSVGAVAAFATRSTFGIIVGSILGLGLVAAIASFAVKAVGRARRSG